jgi:hypothetical protein
MPRKKSPVTPPGIDPWTFRLVVQCLNHYATPGPTHERFYVNLTAQIMYWTLQLSVSLSCIYVCLYGGKVALWVLLFVHGKPTKLHSMPLTVSNPAADTVSINPIQSFHYMCSNTCIKTAFYCDIILKVYERRGSDVYTTVRELFRRHIPPLHELAWSYVCLFVWCTISGTGWRDGYKLDGVSVGCT